MQDRPPLAVEALDEERQALVTDLIVMALAVGDGTLTKEKFMEAAYKAADESKPPEAEPEIWSLAELLANPDLLKSPEPISPALAYEERLTIMAAREKDGKSTLAGWDMSVASHSMPCLWVTYEESTGDVVRRLHGFGADGRVTVARDLTPDQLLATIKRHGHKYVVIDSFASFVGFAFGKVPQTSEGEIWQKHTLELKRLATETGAAVITLAHSPKGADGTIRGSTGIGAAADMIVGMLPPKKNEPANLRTLVFRGRWSVDPIKVRYHSDGFTTGTELDFNDTSIEALVYEFVAANEGCYSREIREGVQGKSQLIDAALKELIASGVILKTRDSHGFAHIAERVMHVDELTGELVEGEDENEGWGRNEPRGEA